MQNEIAYSRPVTLTNILKFAVPTIAMSVFMSFYTMVDGLFVSNLIGTSALSALNLVYPVIALVTAISTMLATGGSAAIMRKMGEAKPDEAKALYEYFCSELLKNGVKKVETGVFGAHMQVSLVNNGPVTIIYDTSVWKK